MVHTRAVYLDSSLYAYCTNYYSFFVGCLHCQQLLAFGDNSVQSPGSDHVDEKELEEFSEPSSQSGQL